MRYQSTAHSNLAASKRSIVIVCAAISLVLGTTSGGASFFIQSEDPALITPSTNALPSNSSDTITRRRTLSPVTNKPLGIQQSVKFTPATPHIQPGRVGIEVGALSVTAVITQINKIAQTPEVTPPPPVPPTPTTPSRPTPSEPPAEEPPTAPEPPEEEPVPPNEETPPEPPVEPIDGGEEASLLSVTP